MANDKGSRKKGGKMTALQHLREISKWAERNLRDYGGEYELHNKLCDMLKSAVAEVESDAAEAKEEERRLFDATKSDAKPGKPRKGGKPCADDECVVTIFDPQLGNIPVDDSRIVYLDKDKGVIGTVTGLPCDYVVCIYKDDSCGQKNTIITTVGYLQEEERRFAEVRKCIAEGMTCKPPKDGDRRFLTDEQMKRFVEANKDKVKIVNSTLSTIDDTPFYYEKAVEYVKRANKYF